MKALRAFSTSWYRENGRLVLSLQLVTLAGILCVVSWSQGVVGTISGAQPRFEFPGLVETTDPDLNEGNDRQLRSRDLARHLAASYGIDSTRAARFAPWILDASVATGVPADRLAALLWVESTFRYKARSSAGAVGPAQVTPRFWEKTCEGDLLRPADNILCGAQILVRYRELCPDRDWECAHQKYNVGPTGYHAKRFAAAKARYLNKTRRARARYLAAL